MCYRTQRGKADALLRLFVTSLVWPVVPGLKNRKDCEFGATEHHEQHACQRLCKIDSRPLER
jgi:hypothetical protein